MKKILCICMALLLAACSFGALAEADLQAQLDAANQKIEELQAQVDAYYPYYAAQIVATFGEDGVIWLKDVEEQYAAAEAQYANYGINLAQYGMVDSIKTSIVDSAVTNGVLMAKATELGLDQFDEATQASMEESAQAMMDEYVEYYISYFYPDAEETTDEMRAEAQKYWEDNGMNHDQIMKDLTSSAVLDAIQTYVTKDVAITDEDVQATYDAMVLDAQSRYADDYNYNNDRNSGAAIAWNPEGYRTVKHVLIKFDDDQAARYNDLQNQLSSLNKEKDAIENPVEATAAPEESAEATETPEPTATPEPRSIEEINADIAACAAEVEAIYAQLLPKAEEVVAAFDAGEDFDALIEKYNEDPGMKSEPTASNGYAVAENSTTWDPAFTEGAMSIAKKGEISAPVYGMNGIHIIYYLDDVPAGQVALEDIREAVEQSALEEKKTSTYDAQVAAWRDEAKVEYFYENFGIAPAEAAQ